MSRVKTLWVVFLVSNGMICPPRICPGSKQNAEHVAWQSLPRTAIRVGNLLVQRRITVNAYSPFLPDLAPVDLFLFPRLKGVIHRHTTRDISDSIDPKRSLP
ncbi:hypothetical protein NPIL_52511 [Nephila pilipes]|uniref:Secreted protein n=1 Tax=Nephila pilipes TaxID=299642 RepID=A0A8X6PAJ7_NEPPI|nr:hypothetical protein NPIL_52511 [Nephila pilipes]